VIPTPLAYTKKEAAEMSHAPFPPRRRENLGGFGEINWTSPVARLRDKRCIRGHLKSGDNLYISPDGQNICRTCVRENQARWRDEKREHYRAYHRDWERNKRRG